ncbi:MAG TPA: glycosyltransferase family 39 protein [Solirubrobacteraceae bacterium]|nr:glycosyltransferase family 39 protein [Solirubrobacteraceae bacterium]
MGRLLAAILVVAFVARLAVVAGTWDAQPWGDPADYHLHGAGLAVFGTYPPTTFAEPGGASALRPPAYPYLLGAVYEVAGVKVNAGRLLGVVLGTATVALLYAIALRLGDRRRALWAAGAAAVFPPLVWLPAALLSEVLFVPLVLGAALLLLRARARPGIWPAAAAGALLGLATLTRGNGILLLAAALLAVVPLRRPAVPVGLVAAFVVVLVPWTVRNASALDAFRPLGTQTGYTMAGQWNEEAARADDFRAAWRVPTLVPAFQDLFRRPGVTEADVDAQLRDRALDFAAERPRHVAMAFGLNALRMFELGPGHGFVSEVAHREGGIAKPWRPIVQASVYALVIAAAAGAWRLRRPRPLWLWSMPVLLLVAVVPLLGSPRYRAPVDPFLILLAAGGLAAPRRSVPRATQR